MSQYGHAAIVILDGSGRGELYELAADSPEHRYPLPWYLTPQRLIYVARQGRLSASLHDAFLASRDVQLRLLNLSPEQRTRLASLLAATLEPARAHFEFGVYTRNCSTRTRDLLDQVLDGELQRQLRSLPPAMSFREHSLRAFASRPWLALAMDLSLGRLADRTPTRWDEAAFPETLAQALDQIRLHSESGDRPLVQSVSTLLSGSAEHRTPPQAPWHAPGLALGGVGLSVLVALRARRRPTAASPAGVERALLAGFGLVGLFLLYLWLVGGERVASWNENLLVYNPLLLMLACTRSPAWRRALARTVLASLALTLLLKCVAHAQANLGWILLAGPSIGYLGWRQSGLAMSSASSDVMRFAGLADSIAVPAAQGLAILRERHHPFPVAGVAPTGIGLGVNQIRIHLPPADGSAGLPKDLGAVVDHATLDAHAIAILMDEAGDLGQGRVLGADDPTPGEIDWRNGSRPGP